MTTINLLPKDKQASGKIVVLRHWVTLLTTIVLIIYLTGMAAALGWWVFLATEGSLTSKDIAAAEGQIRQVSTTEALVREVGKRTDLIQTFLSSRTDVASLSGSLIPEEAVSIGSYKYSAGTQSLSAQVNDLSELEKYTERLKAKYPNIVDSSISNVGDPTWQAEIKL